MGAPKSNTTDNEISILEMNEGELNVCVLGTSPFIFNAPSEKAWHELLMPSGKKNAAEKASYLKHDPFSEYRGSTYQNLDNKANTRLNFLSSAFKKGMSNAALDVPGAQKTQIGRLVWVVGERVDIYGIPKIFSTIVRSADMNRTPDVRTRAILPEWACRLTIRFMRPILRDQALANLLAIAGRTQGVGDWRQQKGSASYGQFRLVSSDDPDFVRICATGGRVAQDQALAEPTRHNEETERLLEWFSTERTKRDGRPHSNGKSVAADEAVS